MTLYAVDLGTTYTKDSMGNIFPSGISEIIYPNSNTLTVEGKKYTVGLVNGIDTNINKGLNRNTKLNFLYSLAKMTQYQDTIFQQVIVGLPCSQWKSEKTVEQFKKYLWFKDIIEVELNGKEIMIQIDSLDVMPEGSTAYYAKEMNSARFNGQKVLLIDWGGLTVNTLLFEKDELIDCHTDELGILKLYQKMAERITSVTGMNVKYMDMYDILTNGLFEDGKKVDIEYIVYPIALEFCYNLHQSFQLRWGIKNIPFVECFGGSSSVMIKYFKEYVPHAELTPIPQTIAVKGTMDMVEVDENECA